MESPSGPAPTRNALLVHAHSESDSFVAAMRDTIAGRLAAAGWNVVHSDLYAMGFNPVLSPADFGSRSDKEHLVYALEQRNGLKSRTLAPDILAEIDKVLAADLVVFTFPMFWFSVPAILKGWIDRVFVSGAFYRGRHIYAKGGLAGKRAFTAFSLGGQEHMFGPGALHGELVSGMLRPFFQGTLGYVGLDVLEPFIAWHVPYVSRDDRTRMLDDLARQIDHLDNRTSIAMPSLDNFDEKFHPI